MDTQSWKSRGNNDIVNEAGELVCVKPFPSMPIEFLNDKGDEKYKKLILQSIQMFGTMVILLLKQIEKLLLLKEDLMQP